MISAFSSRVPIDTMNLSSSPDSSSQWNKKAPRPPATNIERVTASPTFESTKSPTIVQRLLGRSSHHSDDGAPPLSPPLTSPGGTTKKGLIKRLSISGLSGHKKKEQTHGLPSPKHSSSLDANSRHKQKASPVSSLDANSKHRQKASPVSSLDANSKHKQKASPVSSMDANSKHKQKPTTETPIPSLYRQARKCRWQDMITSCQASPEGASYVYEKDGTTALHMAIMSRTGYINTFKSSAREFEEAPLEVIEELLKIYPKAAHVKCTLNGYTPLTYACLVCSETYDVEKAALVVRLFIQYAPDSTKIFTNEGLSPIDIHIVSYSHYHKSKEEDSGRGRTSTSVLRMLCMQNPEFANLRLEGDKVEGPIEYLYKCNQSAFSEAVLDEIYDSDEDGTMMSEFTIPERRQKVVDTVSKWWIWKWAVMIMKYGSLKQKRRGAFFAAVHTAAGQIGCPTNLLSITLYAFPRQVKLSLESKDGIHNLPLHLICLWPCHQDYGGKGDAVVSTRKAMAISRVLEEYPEAAKETNNRGETPLELALMTGTTWDNGVRRLIYTYPKAIKLQSAQTGLYPFMTAAVAAKAGAGHQEVQSIRTIYGILRSNPRVLDQCFQKPEEDTR